MKNIRIKEDLKHRNAKDALEFIRLWRGWCFRRNPAWHIAAHHANFFSASAICGAAEAELEQRSGMPHFLFMLIYPSSIENALREKKKKVKYSGSYGKNRGRFFHRWGFLHKIYKCLSKYNER